MKMTIIFEDFGSIIDKLKKHGISKLSQKEKDEIDADYKKWLEKNKKRHNFPLNFNQYIKDELQLDK